MLVGQACSEGTCPGTPAPAQLAEGSAPAQQSCRGCSANCTLGRAVSKGREGPWLLVALGVRGTARDWGLLRRERRAARPAVLEKFR